MEEPERILIVPPERPSRDEFEQFCPHMALIGQRRTAFRRSQIAAQQPLEQSRDPSRPGAQPL
jgi:hypothetical protein